MSFPRYDSYRDSGVEWLGEVPSHWTVCKLKQVAQLNSGHTPSRQKPEYWLPEDCNIPWFTLADVGALRNPKVTVIDRTSQKISPLGMSNSSARLLPNSTVLLSRTASVGFSAITEISLAVSQDFAAWICGKKVEPRFLLYCLRAMQPDFQRLMMGSTHQTIYMPDIEAFRVPVPSKKDQERVVEFIDRETAKIDGLIEAQRQFIKLLKEKRQAVISHTVTKGLDPTVPMKPSGIEWLGDVPAHWRVDRIKRVAKMESGHTPDRKKVEYWTDCDIPWVSLHDTGYLKDHDFISDTAQKVNELGIANSSARLLRSGVVVFSRDATIGRCGITTREMTVSQHFIAWDCGPDIEPEFLLRCLRSMTQELERMTFGATLKTIGMPDVAKLTIPLPSRKEQGEIVCYVREVTARTEELVSSAESALKLLQERRGALIAAAVTGKIDVRGLAPAASEPAAAEAA